MALLELKNVFYSSEGKPILKGIRTDIEAGDFLSVVGPSGSGKSTLFRLCSHLISQTEGDILFQGRSMLEWDPVEIRKKISYCFQTPYLFGETVMDNLAFPYTVRNRKPDRNRVEELLEAFRIPAGFAGKEARNLSGGEKQRIALVRSLLILPDILLLDEATSALDPENTEVVEKYVASLNREGMTILWITHNPEQSRRHAKRLLTLEAGEVKSLEVIS